MHSSRRLIPFLAAVLPSLLLILSACSDVSPAFGQYFRGRTLDVSLVRLERLPTLFYNTSGDGQTVHHYRIKPSSEEMELILINVKVENHTATSAIVNVDTQAAELRDFFQGKYFPVDVNQRAEKMDSGPDNPRDEWCAGSKRNQGSYNNCFDFLWNEKVDDDTTKAFELKKGFGINGWLVFEAPKETEFREFRWRAGDTLSIEF